MEAVIIKDKKEQKRFIEFRKKIYKNNPIYVDNNLVMIKQVFTKRTCFVENKEIYPINIVDKDNVVCQGIVVYAKELPECIQLCFFESEPNKEKAVKLLVNKAMELGKKHGCKKLVIGLNGHVNYGLGFLDSHYDERNSFSASVNPKYYNDYFRKLKCDEIRLNTYKLDSFENKLDKYLSLIKRLNENYTFRFFDKKQFDYYSKIYTDLNNETFVNHRYYYKRNYQEDKEMLKELFLFMKEDSLIFAFKDEKPIGFIMWYPDYNELSKPGSPFGAREFIKNKFLNHKIQKIKVMEYGIVDEYRKAALPIGLLNQIYMCLQQKYSMRKAETSWILEENTDSNSVCKAICDEEYKRYVVYEKTIK